jgi:tetratricopeptide (TPR) repeat protein
MMYPLPTVEHGWQFFHSGDLAQADQVASRVLQSNRQAAEAWFLRGVVHQVANNFPTALQAYEQALALRPDYLDALNNLGVLHVAMGRPDAAFAVRGQVLRLAPNSAMAHCNYANSLVDFDRLDEAAEYYGRALQLQPDFVDALCGLGSALVRCGRCREALPPLQRALALKPDSFNACNNLGLSYLNLGDIDLAEQMLRVALRLNPRSYEALTNYGGVLARAGRYDEALAYFQQALTIHPDGALALDCVGIALHNLRRFDEACLYFERAVALQPNAANIRASYGKALCEQGRFEESDAQLLEATRLNPAFAEAHNLHGLLKHHVGDEAAAEACFNETLRLDPSHAQARLNRALVWMRRGELDRAWNDYDLRFILRPLDPPHEDIPRWDGSPLEGRTILVRHEQGLGDVLQFLRFLPAVKAKGGRTIVEIPARMIPIASACQGIDEFVATGDPLPKCDVQIPFLSLPAALKTIDAPEPHLVADPKLIEEWAPKIKAIDGFRVGIAWQGDPLFPFDRLRSIPLAEFEPLACIAGVRLISLQKNAGVEQIADNADRVPLVQFGDDIDGERGAFMDTAAIIKNLDLIITSDSAIAHLAGGLGVPVWVALPTVAEWRWFLDRDDSPWYPTMRLFRQTKHGDWAGVFARIAGALRDRLSPTDSHAKPSNEAVSSGNECETPTAPQADRKPDVAEWLVPTSPGELLDKISILRIKSERLTNPVQIENVRTELDALEPQRRRLVDGRPDLLDLCGQLKAVNETLWQVEEDLRQCEKDRRFDDHFIELARSVYKNNDHRAALKRTINTLLDSPIIEEKTHDLPEPAAVVQSRTYVPVPAAGDRSADAGAAVR